MKALFRKLMARLGLAAPQRLPEPEAWPRWGGAPTAPMGLVVEPPRPPRIVNLTSQPLFVLGADGQEREIAPAARPSSVLQGTSIERDAMRDKAERQDKDCCGACDGTRCGDKPSLADGVPLAGSTAAAITMLKRTPPPRRTAQEPPRRDPAARRDSGASGLGGAGASGSWGDDKPAAAPAPACASPAPSGDGGGDGGGGGCGD